MNRERCRLYLITPPGLGDDAAGLAAFSDTLAAALDAGDVACVQLRLKDTPDEVVLRAAGTLMPVAHAREVAFLINDRADLAARAGADGVHIGADDGDYAGARSTVGADRIVGVSCYDSRDRALEAAEAGADYVAFGAFFPTATKAPQARASLDILSWWQQMVTVPCVAIGGITPANCEPLVEAGADFLAVIGGVWDHAQGPAAAVRAFDAAIDRAMARTAG